MVDATGVESQEPGYSVRAFAALVEAAHTEHDFADWLTRMVAAVTAHVGGIEVLTAGRAGSWESAHIEAWMLSAGCGEACSLAPHREAAQRWGGETR